jgi:hypothetical protein
MGNKDSGLQRNEEFGNGKGRSFGWDSWELLFGFLGMIQILVDLMATKIVA